MPTCLRSQASESRSTCAKASDQISAPHGSSTASSADPDSGCLKFRQPASENGLRCDVSTAQVGALTIEGAFALGVSRYGVDALMDAQHEHELVAEDALHVHIDGYHMGVGGDDSWSPSVRPEYLLDQKQYRYEVTLRPSSVSDPRPDSES